MKKNEKGLTELPVDREMISKKIFSMLGLAKKAGFAKSGEFLSEKSVKGFKAGMIIVADDSSDNTRKKFRDMCAFYKVPYFEFGSKDSLGHALGNEMRASVAITDAGMSAKITELLQTLNTLD